MDEPCLLVSPVGTVVVSCPIFKHALCPAPFPNDRSEDAICGDHDGREVDCMEGGVLVHTRIVEPEVACGHPRSQGSPQLTYALHTELVLISLKVVGMSLSTPKK